MEVYVNNITGIDDAICTLYLSKRNIDKKKEFEIRRIVMAFPGLVYNEFEPIEDYEKMWELLRKVKKYGVHHTTLLRFIDISCSVYGLHRGAQDDFDAHAKRLESRIVRSSTRLAKFEGGEKSDYYQDKILTTDEVLDYLNISKLPEVIIKDDKKYVKAPNGYILEDEKDNQDVLRGLYMLSIPSNFIFKCNLVDFAHIVYMRDKNSHAAPELKEMIEEILVQLEQKTNGFITRKFLYDIERVTIPEAID